jgi:eukaryotic-like serine/threonine-protein kinase
VAVSDKAIEGVRSGDILAEKYRVERVLGQGGMGVVVLAEHIELRERVAIKFLLDAPADNAELAERFVREARAAVRIKSEHVVRVVDVGRLPSGAPYMVMEYLEGEDLSQRLLSGPVAIEDAVDYVIQSCEAMHAAHRLGIVHRDLKPANLFLTQRSDGSSLIKVLDFGISKVKTTDAAQLSLTHTQAMMGSPLYMSPEQMRSSKDVSPSADIWSLGVILHELIAGDVPFGGATFPEVLVQVMSGEPPRLRSLRAEVPEGLEAVVACCLEKDPAHRFPSVAALGVALSPYASSRTLGLQTRLRASLSRPPAVLVPGAVRGPVIIELHPLDTGIAVTAPAPAPPASFLPAFAPSGERLPSKTNTAWSEHSAAGAARAGGSRRRWLVGASVALALTGLAALSSLRSPPPGAVVRAPAAATAPAVVPGAPVRASAAPPATRPAMEPPRPREPLIRPAEPSLTPEAESPSDATRGDARSNTDRAEPSLAPVSATQEHTPAAPPTAPQPAPARAATTKERAAAPRVASQPADRPARGRSQATPSTRRAPSALAPRPAAPASKPTRPKPLSIEFK